MHKHKGYTPTAARRKLQSDGGTRERGLAKLRQAKKDGASPYEAAADALATARPYRPQRPQRGD